MQARKLSLNTTSARFQLEHMGHLLKREERTDPDSRVDHFIPDTWQVCFYHFYADQKLVCLRRKFSSQPCALRPPHSVGLPTLRGERFANKTMFFENGDKHRNFPCIVQRNKISLSTSLPQMKTTLSEKENALEETVETPVKTVMLRCNES